MLIKKKTFSKIFLTMINLKKNGKELFKIPLYNWPMKTCPRDSNFRGHMLGITLSWKFWASHFWFTWTSRNIVHVGYVEPSPWSKAWPLYLPPQYRWWNSPGGSAKRSEVIWIRPHCLQLLRLMWGLCRSICHSFCLPGHFQ